MSGGALRRSTGAALLVLLGALPARAQGPSAFEASGLLPTTKRPGARYLGAQACAGCHAPRARTYAHAGMNQAGERADACGVLSARPLLTFASGPYRYRVERRGAQSFYEVTDGNRTVR